jgi:ATP-dependent RNA helicase DDX10/DBP4
VFDIAQLPFDKYALSIGLPAAPKIKFMNKALKNRNYQEAALDNTNIPRLETGNDDAELPVEKKKRSKLERMFEKKNTGVLSEHYKSMIHETDQSDDDILQLARKGTQKSN